ncbi:efflux RND transporter periplasmic adaptor subunit [Oceanobacillus bengalensis]|uniref:Efflux RND transporter periplasmic adaptor subunit n=1 Tax=Oceanobacillus bengalensis TaxID=1435466 RepID=A0A494YYR4_9BACI|nr:efflux RND transporter periplasmic adaptor subunit [Oceanobacillus bengalensis]RKQ15334.1 efflux RND transporter periplasmic adaptor subunit [Oceanobacillus bengalensis]
MRRLLLSVTAILLLIVLAACNEEEPVDEEERVVAVEVAEAMEGNLTVENMIYGRTTPHQTTPVIVQVPGEIDALEVENGDKVEEDDLIATLATAAGNQNIHSTADGEVINLQVQEGDIATTDQPLAMVANLDRMEVQFSVISSVRSLFSKADTLDAMIDGKEYEATVTQMDTLPDDTGLYPIIAIVENEDADILPGMIAEVVVPEEKIDSAIIVPTEAIVEEAEESYVYVVKDNMAEKRDITILETESKNTAIEGDIKAGDQIITTGQLTLNNGIQVNVTGGE